MSRFNKLWAAIAGAVVMAAYGFYDDQILTGDEKIQLVSAAVGAFLVWQTTNGPVGKLWYYAKALAYGVTAVLAALMTTLPNGLTNQEWITLAIAFLAGAGVLGLRNKPEPVKGDVVVH